MALSRASAMAEVSITFRSRDDVAVGQPIVAFGIGIRFGSAL
jgi:hypothetical protein